MSKRKKNDDYNPIPNDLVSGTDAFIAEKYKSIKTGITKASLEPDFYEVDLPIRDLEPNPNNEREDLDVTKDSPLYKSLEMYGLINPLLVVKHPEKDNKYVIIGGNRRYAALVLRHGKESTANVLCRVSLKSYGLENSIKDYVFQIQDNMIRENLSHRDQYNILLKIISQMQKNSGDKISYKMLSTFTSLSEDKIKKIMSFANLSEEDQDFSDQVSMSASVAYAQSPSEIKKVIKESNARTVEDIGNIKRVRDISKTKNVAIPRGHKYRLKHDYLRCELSVYKDGITLEEALSIVQKELQKENQGLWTLIK